jgi:hypothetical protein
VRAAIRKAHTGFGEKATVNAEASLWISRDKDSLSAFKLSYFNLYVYTP